MTKKQFGKDLTEGGIPGHLLRFSIPMLLGNLIQVGHSIVNTIWVGHLVGEDAVGAVGVSIPVLFVTIGLAMGLTMATTILISQYYGAKDHAMLGKVVHNSFSLALIVGAAMTAAGILFGDEVLRLMKAPPENFAMASSYLKISFCSTMFFFMLFAINSVLRGIGDTVTPMVFMTTGIGVNILLDPFAIGGFGPFPSHGLNGAAYATLISQFVALASSLVYLNRKDHLVAFNLRKLTLDRHITLLIFKIGLPSIIQQSLVSFGHMFILSMVNSFGSAATNALGAVARVDMFAFMPAMSVSMAVSAMTGQNIGAGKAERVKDVFKWGVVLTSCMTLAISSIAIFLSGPILRMFGLGGDLKVMEIGMTYLRIVGASYLFVGIMFVAGGVVNGAGHTMVTMVLSILSFWAIRVPGAWFLSKTSLGLTGIWISVGGSFTVGMVMSLIYYYSGRWKKAVIRKTADVVPFMD
jgi:putative MATE family efflux protein